MPPHVLFQGMHPEIKMQVKSTIMITRCTFKIEHGDMALSDVALPNRKFLHPKSRSHQFELKVEAIEISHSPNAVTPTARPHSGRPESFGSAPEVRI